MGAISPEVLERTIRAGEELLQQTTDLCVERGAFVDPGLERLQRFKERLEKAGEMDPAIRKHAIVTATDLIRQKVQNGGVPETFPLAQFLRKAKRTLGLISSSPKTSERSSERGSGSSENWKPVAEEMQRVVGGASLDWLMSGSSTLAKDPLEILSRQDHGAHNGRN